MSELSKQDLAEIVEQLRAGGKVTDALDTAEWRIWSAVSGDYEWAEAHVYIHPSVGGRYIIDTASGCSCESYTKPAMADLRKMEPLVAAQVRYQVVQFFRAHQSKFDSGDVVRYLESLQGALK
jgi:hypothetical protein